MNPASLRAQLQQHIDSLKAFGVDAVPLSTAQKPASGPGKPDQDTPKTSTAEDPQQALDSLFQDVLACRRCPLHATRTHAVLYDGSPTARLMFVGEAPGRDEDLQGKPFVGAAGQLLTKMIQAMGLQRSEVFICNVLKDRPPNNRNPLPEEMAACIPFLKRQIEIVRPEIICTLGGIAAKTLLETETSISRLRGEVYDYGGVPLVPTFHPAYLLRNPSAKRQAWQDLQVVMQHLGIGKP